MSPKDEFELDISEISGDSTIREGVLARMTTPDAPVVDPNSDEYADVVARLTANTDKMWIAYPVPDSSKIIIEELATCTSESFYRWMCYIYPLTKDSKITAEDYKELDSRQKSFVAVIQFLQRLKFPENSLKM